MDDDIVLEVWDGCGPFAAVEAARLGTVRTVSATELRLETEDLGAPRELRTVAAAYLALTFDVRRPRELLATENQQRLARAVARIRAVTPRAAFHGLRLSAAGAGSDDLVRFRAELAERTGLPDDPEDGDLLVRLRRGPAGGWEVLLRLTPRPLATRPWRVVDYPGAVGGPVAASVLALLDPGPDDRLLDLMCGSGTFLVEQLGRGRCAQLCGVDRSPEALAAAAANQRAARRKGRIDWVEGDVLTADLPGGWTVLVANPPWGTLVGTHAENEELHPALLERAWRLAAPGARFGVLTHEITRFRAALDAQERWTLRREHRFFQKGHHPRLFLLDRVDPAA
jgi:tRNA (guanine6-N2)-methyltransferase